MGKPSASLDLLDSSTSAANSALKIAEGRKVLVELDPDHPNAKEALDYARGRAGR